jgi:hypothetical protein
VARYDFSFLAACFKPKLFIHGTEDEIAPLASLEEFLSALPANSHYQLVRIPRAGHFFDEELDQLMQAVRDFAAKREDRG